MRTNLFRGWEGKKINFNGKEVRKGLGQSNDDGLPLIIIQGLQNDSMNTWRGFNLNKVLLYKDGFMQGKSATHK